MKKILIILSLSAILIATQIKREVVLGEYNTSYVCDSGLLMIGNSPLDRTIYFDTTINEYRIYVNSEWHSLGAVGVNLIDTTIQPLVSTTQMQTITFTEATDIKHLTLEGDSAIVIQESGYYRFTMVPLFENTGGGVQTIYFQFSIDTGSGFVPVPKGSVFKEVPATTGNDISTTTLNGKIYLPKGCKIKYEWGGTSTNLQLLYRDNSASGIIGLTNTPSVILELNKTGY